MTLTILLDLDDTLLPNSTESFLPRYLEAISSELSDLAPKNKVLDTLLKATSTAIEHPSIDTTIKQRFDSHFYHNLNTTAEEQKAHLEEFYTRRFPALNPNPGSPSPASPALISALKQRGFAIAIATHPVFPALATHERLRWAGLSPEDPAIQVISTYENFHFGKPSISYLIELISQLGWPETGFIMVGDDFERDIKPARQIGIGNYWVTTEASDHALPPGTGRGSLTDFLDWLDQQQADTLMPRIEALPEILAVMQAVPAALDTIVRQAPTNMWNERPDLGEWNLTEIACHLRDVDQEVHTPRLLEILEKEKPHITAVDADLWAEDRQYHRQDGRAAFESYLQSRKQLLHLIEAAPAEVFKKEIRHTIFGPTDLKEILRIAALHDKLHLRQLHAYLTQVLEGR
jgi:FMN phosphatase YigB (HAD superfamily)